MNFIFVFSVKGLSSSIDSRIFKFSYRTQEPSFLGHNYEFPLCNSRNSSPQLFSPHQQSTRNPHLSSTVPYTLLRFRPLLGIAPSNAYVLLFTGTPCLGLQIMENLLRFGRLFLTYNPVPDHPGVSPKLVIF